MSDKATMPDENWIDTTSAAEAAHEGQAGAALGEPQSEADAHGVYSHGHLPSAHLEPATTGYGQDDPASQAGRIKLDLHDPDLALADQPVLEQPIWAASQGPVSAPAASTQAVAAPASLSELPPVLAHLTQVGLTSSDQWEEQIQPRLQQLHEDIAQVHAQLDVLERHKPTQ